MTKIPTLTECEVALGEAAERWVGRCFEVATRLVESGVVSGDVVYGHYLGPVHEESVFDGHGGFCRHGWVKLEDGRVFDPTRWVFEAAAPYVHVGEADPDYDEGGNCLRGRLAGGPPEFDPDDERFHVTSDLLKSKPWTHVEKLLRLLSYDGDREVDEVCNAQLMWLANAPYDKLQPHAVEIYAMLVELDMKVMIPLDNWRRAERERSKK